MDPDVQAWIASLFGGGATAAPQDLTGGTIEGVTPATAHLLPFAAPSGAPQSPPALVPSAAPAAPSGAPVPNPPVAPPVAAPTAPASPNIQGPNADRILASLRGVQAPPPPQFQHLTTPHPPQPTGRIQIGQLGTLLASLGIPPTQLPTLRLPGRA